MKAIKTLAVTALVVSGLAVVAPASASPKDHSAGESSPLHASCGTNAPDKDSSSWNATARSAANQRSGSSTSCAIKGVLQPSDRADYHCYTDGNDGYTWTFLRNVRTNVTGWVRDDLLEDYGSGVHC